MTRLGDELMRRGTSLRLTAVVAALVIGGLILVALVSARHTNGNATARTRPSPVSSNGDPPTGVPLFYLLEGQDPTTGWFVGFDWTGTARGVIQVAIDQSESLSQAPDGSLFAVEEGGRSGFQRYLDRLGKPFGSQDPTAYESQMWADDSAHLCVLENDSGRWKLGLMSPGSPPTSLQSLAVDSPSGTSIIGVRLRSCSALHDRAILTRSTDVGSADVWVVQISDGTILYHRPAQGSGFSLTEASGDAALIADNSGTSLGYDAGPTPTTTTIERAGDGSVVTTLPPTIAVLAFSGDDSLALVSTSPPDLNNPTAHLALLRVADGSVLWRYDGNEQYSANWIEPHGSDIAVALQLTSEPQVHGYVDVFILGPDGTSKPLPRRFIRPF